MKALLVVALLICVAVLLGWISYSDQGNTASINIDKQQAESETEEAVNTVGEALEDAGNEIEEALDSDNDGEVELDEENRPDEVNEDADVDIHIERQNEPVGT